MTRKIYVASSWRNSYQPEVVLYLRCCGWEVYDFRNPHENDHGFHWSQIDPAWESWTPDKYRRALIDSPIATKGFQSDYDAMVDCNTCVLVLPSGRSAHTEAGWFAGRGIPVHVLMPEHVEPELMYRLFSTINLTFDELAKSIEKFEVPS